MAATDKAAAFIFNKPGVSMLLAFIVVLLCLVIMSDSGLKVGPLLFELLLFELQATVGRLFVPHHTQR